MPKTFRSCNKIPFFWLRAWTIKYFTYGYFLEDNDHLTSFAAYLRWKGFAENLSAWTEYSDTKSLQIADCFNKKYQTIQGRHLGEIRGKMTKKWGKNCEANVKHFLGVRQKVLHS